MEEYGFGAIPSKVDIRDYRLNQVSCAVFSVPKTFQLNSIPIKNQENSPTCVAFSLSEIVEFHHKRQSGEYQRFSTEFIYGNRAENDYVGDGLRVREALNQLRIYGDVYNLRMSGNSAHYETAIKHVKNKIEELKDEAYPNRISTYYRMKTIEEIKYSVVHDGPVVVSMWWYKKAKLDKNYFYTYNTNDARDGHAVLVVGYDEQGFILQNSWGRLWGKGGLFRLKYEDFPVIYEAFGVTDNITDIIKPKDLGFLTKLINFILTIFSRLAQSKK